MIGATSSSCPKLLPPPLRSSGDQKLPSTSPQPRPCPHGDPKSSLSKGERTYKPGFPSLDDLGSGPDSAAYLLLAMIIHLSVPQFAHQGNGILIELTHL